MSDQTYSKANCFYCQQPIEYLTGSKRLECPHCGKAITFADPPRPPLKAAAKMEVIVTDIQIPFGSMVNFMLKWTLATIPAAIILIAFIFGIMALLGTLFSAPSLFR